MPPQTALLLFSSFIIFLLVIDTRNNQQISKAVWIPTIWILIAGSRLISQWLNPSSISSVQEVYLQGNSIDRNFFTMLIFVGFIILFRRGIPWGLILKENALLFLLIAYCGISIFWSDFFFVSFKRWIKFVGIIIMLLIIVTESEPVAATKAVIRRCGFVLIPLSILFIKYFPQIGVNFSPWGLRSVTGVATSKNMLGSLCLVCGIFSFWNVSILWNLRKLPGQKLQLFADAIILAMILWLFYTMDSVTSFVCFLMGIFILFILNKSYFKNNINKIGRFAFIIFIIFSAVTLVEFESIFSSFITFSGHQDTFWGRTELWKELLYMKTNPWVGTGFESFWLGERMLKIWENHWWHPNQAHNGYLEFFINLGLIGLLLLILLIMSNYRRISRQFIINFEYARLRIAFLGLVIVYNITEAAVRGLSIVWICFLLISIEIPQQLSKKLEKSSFNNSNRI